MTATYGDAGVPEVTVKSGGNPGVTTPTDIRQVATMFGADEVEVHENGKTGHVAVEVKGLSTQDRSHLCDALREAGPAGTSVSVLPMDGDESAEEMVEDGREYLTPEELLTVISCLPDDWEPGDDLEFADVDWEAVKPIADDFGGFPELIEAVKRSTAETPESRTDAVQMYNASSPSRGGEADESAAQRREMDAVEKAKAAYVAGDIGILELEDRLEDAIELEHPPTATPS